MKYRLLDGVIYTRVCDQSILVASRPAWGKCPYTKLVPGLSGAFWQGLALGMTEDEIVDELSIKTHIKKEKVRELFENFIQKMEKEGYLVAEESES